MVTWRSALDPLGEGRAPNRARRFSSPLVRLPSGGRLPACRRFRSTQPISGEGEAAEARASSQPTTILFDLQFLGAPADRYRFVPQLILKLPLTLNTALTIAKAIKPTKTNTIRRTALAITLVKMFNCPVTIF